MDAAKITMASQEASTAAGAMIFCTDSLARLSPTAMMTTETATPLIYSIRPCPKGCSGSGFLPASRKPASVMMEEAASEILLKASAVMATECESTPAKYLPANSNRLSAMPTPPQRVP